MAAGKEFSREEGTDRLAPSSTVVRVAEVCVHVSVDCALVPLTWAMLMGSRGRFGQLNLNMEAQSV